MAVARLNASLFMRDPGPILAYVAMPVLLMFFLAPLYGQSTRSPAAGNAQAVAGMAVMFAMFVINVMGTSFFGEHGWRTWQRLRAAPATSVELLAGKALPVFVVLGVQSTLILAVGMTALHVPLRGSPFALAAVVIAYQLSVLALGLCLIALSRTRGQLGVLADAGGMLFACMGGALVPAAALPGWASAVAPIFPSHWAMRGMTTTIDGHGLTGAATAAALLLAFAATFLTIAAAGYRRFDCRSS